MTTESHEIEYPSMHSVEAPDVVLVDGEVRSQDDVEPVFPDELGPSDDEEYADEPDGRPEQEHEVLTEQDPRPVEESSVPAQPKGRVGVLVGRVEDWLDVPRGRAELTLEDALRALNISREAYDADYEAFEALRAARASTLQIVPERISGRSIIEAGRQRALDDCKTEAEKVALRAKFVAEDERRQL